MSRGSSTNLRLPIPMRDAIDAYAEETGATRSALIREAVAEYLNRRGIEDGQVRSGDSLAMPGTADTWPELLESWIAMTEALNERRAHCRWGSGHEAGR